MNSSYIKRYCLLGVFLCLSIFASAQPDPLPDDPGVPIDGGGDPAGGCRRCLWSKKAERQKTGKAKEQIDPNLTGYIPARNLSGLSSWEELAFWKQT